jgi:hypothetical protein
VAYSTSEAKLLSDNSKADELSQTIIKTINERKPQNAKQLINFVKERLPITEEKVLEAILKLQNQGTVKLENQPLPASPKLATYMKTGQALWYWATIAIATITVAIVFTVPEAFYPWSYLRNALGTIFVLWLPGYTFMKALFPLHVPIKLSTENLDNIERVALSLGMSLALVPIIGLLLNYTPWGIRLTPLVLSLFALTLVFATAAVIRENQIKKQTWKNVADE